MTLPRRQAWFLAVALIVNLLRLGGPRAGEAHACGCAVAANADESVVEESFEKSAAVFSGKVVKVEEAPSVPPDGDDPFLGPVTFEVEEAWKGASEGSVVVYGQGPEAGCGRNFEEGETYLVYAYRTDDYLATDYCGRTKPVELASSDLRELDAARGSLPDTGGPGASPLEAMIVTGVALSMLTAAALVSRGIPRD